MEVTQHTLCICYISEIQGLSSRKGALMISPFSLMNFRNVSLSCISRFLNQIAKSQNTLPFSRAESGGVRFSTRFLQLRSERMSVIKKTTPPRKHRLASATPAGVWGSQSIDHKHAQPRLTIH